MTGLSASERDIQMPVPQILAVSARTASLLVVPEGAKYTLPAPIRWTLTDAEHVVVKSGEAHSVGIFLDKLTPNSTYLFESDLGSVRFQTQSCAGLIDAMEFGVTPDAKDNGQALQRAIEAVPKGGTLRVGAGTYASSPLFLHPNMTLLLERGCILSAISNRSQWPILNAHDEQGRVLGTWEGLPEASHAALITGIDCHNLTITGAGTIDGGGSTGDWWQWPKETRAGARRPRTIHLAHSNQVTLTGVAVRNSPSWTVHPYCCNNLHVSNVSISNPPTSPNTDGLNPESCEDVTISAVHFSVGDDCIAIKAGKRAIDDNSHLVPTRGIAIQNCLMERGHGAVVLGSEISGGIFDIDIRNCEFNATDRGLRIKTRRGRGGEVSSIRMSDVDMTDVPTPLAINAFYYCDPDGKSDWVQSREPAPVSETTPIIKDVSIERVSARGVTTAFAAVLGLPEAPISGVTIRDVTLTFAPNPAPDVPLMALHVPTMGHAGLWAEFATVDHDINFSALQKDTAPC
ncbi:glycoside hydrolase family 28 protein [uncultured Pelagimonas sp.]|uniref:polygalacturonase PglA n=1 Tax=uncultured Pelagimonas sp. TaxID=1618102 RepID=UPI002602CEEE|nr:glycoside hydrolase family 28 protein [uncultured Pelagimonas sp.]